MQHGHVLIRDPRGVVRKTYTNRLKNVYKKEKLQSTTSQKVGLVLPVSVATLPGQRRLPEVSSGRIAYRGRGGSIPLEPAKTPSSGVLAI